MTYPEIRQRLVGVAFVAGPLLMVASALALLLNIGRNPGVMRWGSSVEGYIGFYGFVLLVPVFLYLADRLGQHMPKFAALIAVIALIGFAGGGVMQMVMRAMIADFAGVGVSEATFEQVQANFETGQSPLLLPIMMGPLIPLSSLLLGVGFILAGQMQWRAWLLAAAGVLLLAGQFFMVATEITYTAALLLWAIILVPMGVQLLRSTDRSEIYHLQP